MCVVFMKLFYLFNTCMTVFIAHPKSFSTQLLNYTVLSYTHRHHVSISVTSTILTHSQALLGLVQERFKILKNTENMTPIELVACAILYQKQYEWKTANTTLNKPNK